MNDWQTSEGLTATTPIESGAVDNLLFHLSVAAFMLYPACSPTGSAYADAATKWNTCDYQITILKD